MSWSRNVIFAQCPSECLTNILDHCCLAVHMHLLVVRRKFFHRRSADQVNPAEPLVHRLATIRSAWRGSMNRGSRYKWYKRHMHNRNERADKSEPPASTPASTSLQATTFSKLELL